jgi:hypothetical protein
MAVDTGMLRGGAGSAAEGAAGPEGSGASRPEAQAAAVAGILSTERVADSVVAGIRDERFLILPHPAVATFEQRRAADRDRWLAGMRRLGAALAGGIRRIGTEAPPHGD